MFTVVYTPGGTTREINTRRYNAGDQHPEVHTVQRYHTLRYTLCRGTHTRVMHGRRTINTRVMHGRRTINTLRYTQWGIPTLMYTQ